MMHDKLGFKDFKSSCSNRLRIRPKYQIRSDPQPCLQYNSLSVLGMKKWTRIRAVQIIRNLNQKNAYADLNLGKIDLITKIRIR